MKSNNEKDLRLSLREGKGGKSHVEWERDTKCEWRWSPVQTGPGELGQAELFPWHPHRTLVWSLKRNTPNKIHIFKNLIERIRERSSIHWWPGQMN